MNTTATRPVPPPVVRGGKIAHTAKHDNCLACHVALDAAYARRDDI